MFNPAELEKLEKHTTFLALPDLQEAMLCTQDEWNKLLTAARRGMETKSGKIYQHYKGGLYELICYASYENGEAAGVVYRSLDTGIVWIRPQEEFAAKFKPAPLQPKPET